MLRLIFTTNESIEDLIGVPLAFAGIVNDMLEIKAEDGAKGKNGTCFFVDPDLIKMTASTISKDMTEKVQFTVTATSKNHVYIFLSGSKEIKVTSPTEIRDENIEEMKDDVQRAMKAWTATTTYDFELKERVGEAIGRDCSNVPSVVMFIPPKAGGNK